MRVPNRLCHYMTVIDERDSSHHDIARGFLTTSDVDINTSMFQEFPVSGGNNCYHAKLLSESSGLPGKWEGNGHTYTSGLWVTSLTSLHVMCQGLLGDCTYWVLLQSTKSAYPQIQVFWYYPRSESTVWQAYSTITLYRNGTIRKHTNGGFPPGSPNLWAAELKAAIHKARQWDGKSITSLDDAIRIVQEVDKVASSSYIRELLFGIGGTPTSYISGLVFYPTSYTSPDLSKAFLLDEPSLLFGGGISTRPYSAYFLKAWRQEAYVDALDHIPQLNDNNLSTIFEVVGFIKALVFEHRIEIPNSLQSLWLSYRYSYNTTKMDVEEAISFVHRYMDVGDLTRGISCYGQRVFEYKGTPVTVRCRIDVKAKELSFLDSIWSALYKYGLSPSFYAIWDMIPYSFIVDWFIPIGDALNESDMVRNYERTYDITNIWYSLKYAHADESGALIRSYSRWKEGSSPGFSGYYTLENKGTPSNKVIGFRILDALSLSFK